MFDHDDYESESTAKEAKLDRSQPARETRDEMLLPNGNAALSLPQSSSIPLLEPVTSQRGLGTGTRGVIGVAVVLFLSALTVAAVGGFRAYQETQALSLDRADKDQKIKELQLKIEQLRTNKYPAADKQIAALSAEIETIRQRPVATPRESAEENRATKDRSQRRIRKQSGRSHGSDMASAARNSELERVAAKMTKPDKTNLDGLSGASITWTPEPKQKKKQAANEDTEKRDELDNLLGSALNRPAFRKSRVEKRPLNKPDSAEGKGLSERPTREQVELAMDAIAPAIKQCGKGDSGRIHIKFAFSGATGRVIDAHPASSGDFAGTPIGLCAARKARLAKLPRFSKSRVVIKYPFSL
ncbi:MAG: hypothetical protein GY847_32735 [Proteobacteria bacterium]|nr:hypothetical protein [Pseudomonadota bacterium]